MAKPPIDKTGPQFVIDQLCAQVETAAAEARVRTGDETIRACMDEDGVRVFCVARAGHETCRAMSADDATAALEAMQAAEEP